MRSGIHSQWRQSSASMLRAGLTESNRQQLKGHKNGMQHICAKSYIWPYVKPVAERQNLPYIRRAKTEYWNCDALPGKIPC